MARVELDRTGLTDVLAPAMRGAEPRSGALPFALGKGRVKTYVLEVNGLAASSEAMERVRRLAHDLGVEAAETADRSLAMLWGEGVILFVDVLDPRFWMIHSVSAASAVQRLLRKATWSSREIDSCWFPWPLLRQLQAEGEPRWFKSDFEGDDLLPVTGVAARRLRVQLEGDAAGELFDKLVRADDRFKLSTALTSVATRVRDDVLGNLDELAHYRGRFIARGDSFEMHLGFVARAVESYKREVQRIEDFFRISWRGSEERGVELNGRVLTIDLGRPIPDLERFTEGLFSCRDPFRLWAVPRFGPGYVEAEAVDLHVGVCLRLEIAPVRIRVLLTERACGNTALRLIANLERRYDATVRLEDASPHR